MSFLSAFFPLDPTSPNLEYTATIPQQPTSAYLQASDPVNYEYSFSAYSDTTPQEQKVVSRKHRSPFPYRNTLWPSPLPVTIVNEILKYRCHSDCRGPMRDLIMSFGKNGEERITHEIAIRFLAFRQSLTPEEFLKTSPPKKIGYWARKSNPKLWLSREYKSAYDIDEY